MEKVLFKNRRQSGEDLVLNSCNENENEPSLSWHNALFNKALLVSKWALKQYRFRFFRSRGALLVLLWNTLTHALVSLINEQLFHIYHGFDSYHANAHFRYLSVLPYALAGVMYPLAGFLADVYIGRYKMLCGSVVIVYVGLVLGTAVELAVIATDGSDYKTYGCRFLVMNILVCCLLLVGLAGFQSTVIQFGTDQLLGSSSNALSSFIHWFVFSGSLGLCLYSLVKRYTKFIGVWSIFTAFFSLMIMLQRCCLSKWYNVEPTTSKAIKNLFGVFSFARKHRHPLRPSAFAYCRSDKPSRMDFAKRLYGGPFSNEEVENAKTFMQIAGLLFALLVFASVMHSPFFGTVFLTQYKNEREPHTYIFLLGINSLACALTIVFLEVLFNPLFPKQTPQLLTKVCIGIALKLATIGIDLIIDAAEHNKSGSLECLFAQNNVTEWQSLNLTHSYLALPTVVDGVGQTIFEAAILEFILAQAPNFISSILLGIYYSINLGLSNLLPVIIMLVFTLSYEHTAMNRSVKGTLSVPAKSSSVMSCGSAYFLTNICIGLLGLVLFVAVACRYKRRERDDVVNTYLFAEEYYSKYHSTASSPT